MAVQSPIIYQLPLGSPASTGTLPNFKFMVCGNSLSEVVSAGFLNQVDLQSNPLSSTDVLQILYNFNPHTQVGDYAAFTVTINNGIITLAVANTPGEVILPVVVGHFANWASTAGALSDVGYVPVSNTVFTIPSVDRSITPTVNTVPSFLTTTGVIGKQFNGTPYVVNGPFSAGGGGIAGTLSSNPSAISSGTFILQAINVSAGDFSSTIRNNASILAARTYNLPDPNVASSTIATFPAFPSAITPGHLLVAGPAAGTIVDGGAPPTPAAPVLLTPAGDQVITAFELTVAEGSLNLGKVSNTNGVLTLFNAFGNSAFQIFSNLAGPSAANNVLITTGLSLAQDTNYVLPDPGAAGCTFNVTATSVTAGNILVAGASDGLLVDSGVAVSQLELVSNVKAQQTGNIGGAGAGPLTVTQAVCTAASIITANVVSSSNPCFVQAITAGIGSFDVTMSADPGASLILNYVMFVAAQ